MDAHQLISHSKNLAYLLKFLHVSHVCGASTAKPLLENTTLTKRSRTSTDDSKCDRGELGSQVYVLSAVTKVMDPRGSCKRHLHYIANFPVLLSTFNAVNPFNTDLIFF